MLRDLWLKSLKRALRPVLVLIGAAAFLLVCGRDIFQYARGPQPFESLTMEELNGKYVQIHMDFTFGCFAEEITSYGINERIPEYYKHTSSTEYHVVPVGGLASYMSEADRPFQFAAIEIGAKTAAPVTENSEKFFKEHDPAVLDESADLIGFIRPLKGELLEYYKEFFLEAGYSEEEYETYCAPYYLKISSRTEDELRAHLLGSISFLLLSCAALILLAALSGVFQWKARRILRAEGPVGRQVAESDYNMAGELCKGVRGGRHYLFCYRRMQPQILKLNRIVWAYPWSVTYRNESADVTYKTIYKVMLYTDYRKIEMIRCKDGKMCDAIMEYLADAAPTAMLGYRSEWKYLYQNAYEEFMQMYQEKKMTAGMRS